MITAADISGALFDAGVVPSDTMFVHSDVRSSLRVEGSTLQEKLSTIAAGLRGAVPEGTLVMPTFTYSFAKGEEFDVTASPSTVGGLTEWFRRQPGVRRTSDPFFSVAVEGPVRAGWEQSLFDVGDTDCFGPRSVFAYLHEAGAKLVCYGVDIQALTFAHYAEQLLAVPYRSIKEFPGIVRKGGEERPVIARYNVRELLPETEVLLHPLAEALLRDGRAHAATVPDRPTLFVTDTASALEVIERELAANPDFLLRRGHEHPPPG